MSQADLLIEYFKRHPKRDIPHPEIVDWVTEEWKRQTGGVFRDPDRAIRKLHQQGLLIKVKKGIYRYDPEFVENREDLEDFSPKIKKEILERDGYKCALCGKGLKEGAELHIDHIKPKDKGGKATLDNGQTLCSECNILKKRYGTTDFLRKYSHKILKIARKYEDKEVIDFFEDILEVIKKHEKKA
ncbi:HNH endonuclease [Candidatus Woesearchaeota archaeon]|nr:HNH endonuclease [Candidatus Woesearchaeota archaeon]